MDLQWVAVRVESNKLKYSCSTESMPAVHASHRIIARQYALVSQCNQQQSANASTSKYPIIVVTAG